MIKAQLNDGLTRTQRWRKGKGKDYSKTYHRRNKDKINSAERERYANNREYISFIHKMWYKDNKYESCMQHKKYRKEQCIEAMAGYGSECLFCGEDRLAGLVFHHVNGDGIEHRKGIKGSLYKWIIENDFPDNIILLCGTCHLILHEVEKSDYNGLTS